MRNEAGLEWGGGGTGQMRHFKPPAVTFPGDMGFIRAPGSHAQFFAHIDM